MLVFIASLQIIFFLCQCTNIYAPIVKRLRKSFVSPERIFYLSPSQLCKKSLSSCLTKSQGAFISIPCFYTYLSEVSSWFIGKEWDLRWHNCCLWCRRHHSARGGGGGLGACSPGNFEKWKQLGCILIYSEQKCDVTLNWNLPLCVESPCYRSAVSMKLCEHVE